jgi:hypothetical protein
MQHGATGMSSAMCDCDGDDYETGHEILCPCRANAAGATPYVVVRQCPEHGQLTESLLATYGLPSDDYPEDNDKCPIVLPDENGCGAPLGPAWVFIYQGPLGDEGDPGGAVSDGPVDGLLDAAPDRREGADTPSIHTSGHEHRRTNVRG